MAAFFWWALGMMRSVGDLQSSHYNPPTKQATPGTGSPEALQSHEAQFWNLHTYNWSSGDTGFWAVFRNTFAVLEWPGHQDALAREAYGVGFALIGSSVDVSWVRISVISILTGTLDSQPVWEALYHQQRGWLTNWWGFWDCGFKGFPQTAKSHSALIKFAWIQEIWNAPQEIPFLILTHFNSSNELKICILTFSPKTFLNYYIFTKSKMLIFFPFIYVDLFKSSASK